MKKYSVHYYQGTHELGKSQEFDSFDEACDYLNAKCDQYCGHPKSDGYNASQEVFWLCSRVVEVQ